MALIDWRGLIMDIWIITRGHDSAYVSAWRTKETADAEVERLNATSREFFEVMPDDLNG
jgi:hypothetical protein